MKTPHWLIACLFLTFTITASAVCAQTATRPDLLIADFEGDSYGDWKTEGDAFGTGPAKGTLPGQMQVSGFAGQGLVNSFRNGDGSTGTLTSPPLEIQRRYLGFLIGGGGHAGETCMNLLADGEVVRTITGDNTQPGGSEELSAAFWDVTDLAGSTVTIQIVDTATGGWGHINVDHLVLTDTKPAAASLGQREKSFTVEQRFLLLPIQNKGKAGGRLQLFVDNAKVRDYALNIAPSVEETDWYAFFTIDAYKGRQARVVASKVTEQGFDLIQQSDSIPGERDFYKEPHRPQFHFTQKVGWNNDPNGMVYHNGTWHLFFQHNPVALPWGNMTWGHATSKDLVHWEQQPNKLFPKTTAVGDCFSGGATIDKDNTAGWGENTLVAFLTDTGAGESIAYSTDGGETFTWYEGNPVVKHKGRDPKVIWYAYGEHEKPIDAAARKLGGHWVMIVYDEHPEYDRNAAFYTSTNLKEWTERSHLPGYFECTELFELPVDGDPQNTRWVVFAADAKYAVGRFDGKTFTPLHEGKHQVHYGPYYASQTFDNAPDGRRIQIGWLRIESPGPYNQHFSFPHRLTLRTTGEGIRMFAQPIDEIELLHVKESKSTHQELVAGQPVSLSIDSDLLDVRLAFEIGTAKAIELALPGRTITYDCESQTLHGAPLRPVDGRITVQVLADRSITEIVGNEGRVYVSDGGPGRYSATAVTVTSRGGNARLLYFDAHELKSIWTDKPDTE